MSVDQPNRQELLAKMKTSGDKLQSFLNSLTSDQLQTPRDKGGWAVKDHVIHLAMWENGLLALLKKEDRQVAMGISEDAYVNGIESINAAIFENHRHLSVEEVLVTFQATYEDVLNIVESMQDDDILLPYKHFDSDADDERPILHWIIINTYEHYDMHMPWMEAIVVE